MLAKRWIHGRLLHLTLQIRSGHVCIGMIDNPRSRLLHLDVRQPRELLGVCASGEDAQPYQEEYKLW